MNKWKISAVSGSVIAIITIAVISTPPEIEEKNKTISEQKQTIKEQEKKLAEKEEVLQMIQSRFETQRQDKALWKDYALEVSEWGIAANKVINEGASPQVMTEAREDLERSLQKLKEDESINLENVNLQVN